MQQLRSHEYPPYPSQFLKLRYEFLKRFYMNRAPTGNLRAMAFWEKVDPSLRVSGAEDPQEAAEEGDHGAEEILAAQKAFPKIRQ